MIIKIDLDKEKNTYTTSDNNPIIDCLLQALGYEPEPNTSDDGRD